MHFDTNKTKELHGFTGDSIIHYYSYLFDVGEHNEWRLKHTIYKERESFGNYTTYIYEAYHKGYSTNKNVFYFDVKNEQIFRGKEISVVDDLDVDTTVIITSNEAKKNAVNDVHGNKRIWQIRMSKKLIEKDNKYNLVYAAVIWTLSPYNQYEVLIDKKNGDILDNY